MYKMALIDADSLRYQCGHTAQTDVKYVETSDGMVEFSGKTGKKDARAYCILHELDFETSYKKDIRAAPIENCLHTVKSMLHSIKEKSNCEESKLILSGKNNFRLRLDDQYKANRDPNARPVYYDDITEYMIKVHGAIVTDGQEADDYLIQEQRALSEFGTSSVICTLDKDLNTHPGLRYNWNKDEDGVFIVGPNEATLFFHQQLLQGDAGDNIKGLRGDRKNPERRMKGWLASLQNYYDHLPPLINVEDLELALLGFVCKAYEQKFSGHVRQGYWQKHLAIQANLLYLRKDLGQLWPYTDYLEKRELIEELLARDVS